MISKSSTTPGPILLLTFLLISSTALVPRAVAGNRTTPIILALGWLESHQKPDGSYGSLTELQTAPAADALWIRYRNISNVTVAYAWLRNQIQNSSTYFWSGGSSPPEADIPGEIMYSFSLSQHLGTLNMSFVAPRLLGFQESNGGFMGYYDTSKGKQVTDSVDTSMALLGLINGKAISALNLQAAVSYLLSLQNADGSFNLTRTLSSSSLSALGPEPISMTAQALLVLKYSSYTVSDKHVVSAISYLENAVSTNFGGHVYAASLAAIVFTAFGRFADASMAVSFVLSQQNSDGGFRDIIRSSMGSNALDTGWAAFAFQVGGLGGDVNFDGTVNIIDLATVASAFGATVGSQGWKPVADVNGDGTVNIVDLAITGANFGRTADSL